MNNKIVFNVIPKKYIFMVKLKNTEKYKKIEIMAESLDAAKLKIPNQYEFIENLKEKT